jgi:hypothetical protein
MIDRGLPDARDQQPTQIVAGPVRVTGLDGAQHVAHPGALFDDTRSYNFEDVRNGMFAVSFLLNPSPSPVYFTDDISNEPNFSSQQKVLDGAIPVAAVRNAAGTRLFVAHSGSDRVQELEAVSGSFRLRDGARSFQTRSGRSRSRSTSGDGSLVATWGGERLEVFDLGSGNRRLIDLGYATAVPGDQSSGRVPVLQRRLVEQRPQVVRRLPHRRAAGRRHRLLQRRHRADRLPPGPAQLQPGHHRLLLLERLVRQRQLRVAGLGRADPDQLRADPVRPDRGPPRSGHPGRRP